MKRNKSVFIRIFVFFVFFNLFYLIDSYQFVYFTDNYRSNIFVNISFNYDNRSEPLENAEVSIYKIDYYSGNNIFISKNFTNSSGECKFNISSEHCNNDFLIVANFESNSLSQNVHVNCNTNVSVPFNIDLCVGSTECNPLIFRGTVYNESQGIFTPKENLTVKAISKPLGGKTYSTIYATTKTDENGTSFDISIENFFKNWPMNITISIDPTEEYFFRYNNNFYYNILYKGTGSMEPIAIVNFIAHKRKNFNETCNFSDECIGDNCYNNKCVDCIRGDADRDKDISIFDSVEILKYLSNRQKNISVECVDLNNNNEIDLDDAIRILENIM